MANKGKREVEAVEFRPAKGGVISETKTKVHRGGQGGGPDYDYEREETGHPTHEHAAAHLKKMLGHAFGQAPVEPKADDDGDEE